MGILKDIVDKMNGTRNNQHIKKGDNNIQATGDVSIDGIIKYNRIWLVRTANKHDFDISDNDTKVSNILKALNKRDGHCPCGGMTEDFMCPCKWMREFGACKCGLFVEPKDVEPRDSKTTGSIKTNE